MGAISYLLKVGIVRVAFVPIMMALLLYALYALAAPPKWKDDDAQGQQS